MQEVARTAVGTDAYGTYYLILSKEVVSQSITSNYSLTKIQISLSCPVWISFSSATLKITSSTGDIGTVQLATSYGAGTHVLWNNGDGWTLGHDDKGVLDYAISAYIHATYLLDGTVSGKITAPNIPRYTTAYQSVKSITETSIAMNWLADDTVDYIWYSINNGSSWTGIDVTDGTSGTYTISGLSPNTTYNIKTRVRRKDSQLTTDTSALPVTTYKVPTQSLKSKTETSITMNWACDTTADHIWYSKDNGANWNAVGTVNATSGSYTISGLSPSTTYNIKTRIRRKATQTTYDTATSQQTTYDYPHITKVNTSNLIIGNSQTVTIYNPLGRNVTITMRKDSSTGTILYAEATTKTSLPFTPTASTLYNSIPNSKSANCVYTCTYENTTKATSAYTYSINESQCYPTFTKFIYEDVGKLTSKYNNSIVIVGDISDLTGNNQLLVNGYSSCKFTISTTNKAVAKNGASISKYKFEWGTQSNEVAYSSTAEVTSTIAKSSGNVLKVTAIDSRGLSTTVPKTVPIIPYVNAKISEVTTQRKNGVDVETYLSFKASIWNGNWNNSSNSNYTNQLKYVGYRVYNGSAWTSYFDITEEVKELMTTSTSGNSTTINLSIDKNLPIHANGTSGGFEIGKQYTIQLLIRNGTSTETLSSIDYQATAQGTVTDGKVGLSRYKGASGNYHYGINGMPSADDTLIIHGNLKAESFNGEIMAIKTNPVYGSTTATSYSIPFMHYTQNASNPMTIRYNNGIGYDTFEGTTNLVGHGRLVLGNNIKQGTDGNKVGEFGLYARNNFIEFLMATQNPTANRILYLPDSDGILDTKPVTLYNNASGTSGTITLSQSVAKFTKIKIYISYTGSTSDFGSIEAYAPNHKYIAMSIVTRDASTGTNVGMFIHYKTVLASETTLTVSASNILYYYQSNSKPTIDNRNIITITRVEGIY